MANEKRTGLGLSVTAEERAILTDLCERLGGLSYVKLVMKLARDEVERLDRRG